VCGGGHLFYFVSLSGGDRSRSEGSLESKDPYTDHAAAFLIAIKNPALPTAVAELGVLRLRNWLGREPVHSAQDDKK
jgi:hypothetical protein